MHLGIEARRHLTADTIYGEGDVAAAFGHVEAASFASVAPRASTLVALQTDRADAAKCLFK